MASGRSTPVAMTSPPPSPTMTSTSSPQASAVSGAQNHGQTTTRRPSTAGPLPPSPRQSQTTSCLPSPILSTPNIAGNAQQTCFLQSLLDTSVDNFTVVRGSLLTALGVGWAVYSRVLRYKIQAYMGGIDVLQSGQSKESLSDFCAEKLEVPRRIDRRPRLHTTAEADGGHNHRTSPSDVKRVSFVDTVAGGDLNSPQDHGANVLDPAHAARELLQKHFNYLMPWVSSQPSDDDDPEETIADSTVTNELSRMSMQSFTELSTAIYRDVRRREQESSPESPYPPKWDQCIRNRQNDSRMVLCRTINEQFYRLVLALVLEQARRLVEIRIRLDRRAAMTKRATSPLIG